MKLYSFKIKGTQEAGYVLAVDKEGAREELILTYGVDAAKLHKVAWELGEYGQTLILPRQPELEKFTHVQRPETYELADRNVTLQTRDPSKLIDQTTMVLYRDSSGKQHVREADEFAERFRRVDAGKSP